MSQQKLAELVGTKQQTIEKIERGVIKRSSFLPQILSQLELDLGMLVQPGEKPSIRIGQSEPLIGPIDLPVHGAAQAGSRGAVIVTTDPVEYVARPQPLLGVTHAYAIIVVEDSMVPEFEPGDYALVHPHQPPRAGHTCVFYAQAADGSVEALIKRLRRVTADAWHVREWNGLDGTARDFALKRSEWQKCHVVVGNYKRR